jgi:hypothetical protein
MVEFSDLPGLTERHPMATEAMPRISGPRVRLETSAPPVLGKETVRLAEAEPGVPAQIQARIWAFLFAARISRKRKKEAHATR